MNWLEFIQQHEGIQAVKRVHNLSDEQIKDTCKKAIIDLCIKEESPKEFEIGRTYKIVNPETFRNFDEILENGNLFEKGGDYFFVCQRVDSSCNADSADGDLWVIATSEELQNGEVVPV